ncbi:MAG: hypothetical protein WDZ89_02535, partial [Gemmatimonadota bacterium]
MSSGRGGAPAGEGTRRPGSAVRAIVLVLGGLLAAPAALAAQQGGAPPPVRADTLSADSARARVLERLRRLSAPAPEPDTLRAEDPDAVPGDTAGVARPGAEPGAPVPARRAPRGRVGGEPSDSVMRALMDLPGYMISRYSGNRMDFQGADGVLNLYGTEEAPARFIREDLDLSADSAINYNEGENRVRTVGRNTLAARG